jgi:hypothetical protein
MRPQKQIQLTLGSLGPSLDWGRNKAPHRSHRELDDKSQKFYAGFKILKMESGFKPAVPSGKSCIEILDALLTFNQGSSGS